ncbi:hypothetical protein ACLB2K_014900 [Fragaria x ananassa]
MHKRGTRIGSTNVTKLNSWKGPLACLPISLAKRTSESFFVLISSHMRSRLSLANKRNREEKTMHHYLRYSPIIYIMEELILQGEQLPIIKGFEKTYVRADDEVTTKHYNDMVDEEQHSDVMNEQIIESVQFQQIEVLGTVLKTRKGKEIGGMGRGGKRHLSHSSNGSTSRSCPPRVDEQQLQEVQERYEQKLKESEERQHPIRREQ